MQTGAGDGALAAKKRLTPEDIWGDKSLQPKPLPGLRLMDTAPAYTWLEGGRRVIRVNADTGQKTTLFDARDHPDLGRAKVEYHAFSRDETKTLVGIERKKLWRHSFTARHFIFDIRSGRLDAVSDRPVQRCAALSPDGACVAFVAGNDIFLRLRDGSERRITTDGAPGEVINGAPDWVYEEEFGLQCGMEWSPDGRRLAFFRFDESRVPAFTLFKYDGDYPEPVTFKYPRAGEPNAAVSLHVYDVATGDASEVARTDGRWEYFPRIQWLDGTGELALLRMNRRQDRYEWSVAAPSNTAGRILLAESRKPYVEAPLRLHLLDNGCIVATSERSGYRRLHLFDRRGRHLRQLTDGEEEVLALHGVDDDGCAFFTVAGPQPKDRTLRRCSVRGSQEWPVGPLHGAASVSFNRAMTRVLLTHSSWGELPVTSVYSSHGTLVCIVKREDGLRRRLKAYEIPHKEQMTLPGADGGPLRAWVLRPPETAGNGPAPLLLTVYGGPDSQTVVEGWGLGWEHYLAQEGFMVASVDGRGTGARGEAFRKCTHGRLGALEVEDLAAAARHLAEAGLADPERIGVFGWSYGGFMAAGCILRRPDVFRAAVAVAPVTHYRYYDSVYTERLMGLPSRNPRGYRENAPLTYAKNLQGRLLLVHGLNDDNVHAQNSLDLVEALIKEGKDFETHFLPNRDHGITGGKTRLHLYKRLTAWLNANLKA